MKKLLLLFAVLLMGAGIMAQNSYFPVTSETQLSDGDKVILVGYNDDGQAYAMSYQKSNNRHAVNVNSAGGSIVTEVSIDPNNQTLPFEITIGGGPGQWTFFDELNNGYLYAPGGGNYLKTQTNLDDKGKWSLSMDGEGFIPTSNGGAEQNIMRYNPNTQNNSPLFGCYKPSSSVNDLVFIFKAGGSEPDPEPAFYPEDFDADVDENTVYLTWTEVVAPTGQPARAYLIVGSTGNISVPVDGTPVANDLNAADGNLAYNIMAGNDMCVFNQLPGNTTFRFAIFPYTNSGSNINYKTDGNYPTTTVTTDDIYCLLQSDFAHGLEPFEAVNVEGEQQWVTGVYDGVYFAKMTGYSGGAHSNEDWLVSPNLFSLGTFETVKLSFMNAYKFDGNPLQVLMTSEYQGQGNPQSFSWDDITDLFEWSQGEYEWASTEAELPVGRATRLYIAFVYTSTDNAASTWEVADVKVTGTGYDAVGEQTVASLSLYPNPAHEVVSFTLDNDAQVSIFDVTGRVISTTQMAAGEGNCQVANLENGVYVLNIRYVDGKTQVARFVKY
jgi:hypothetical protein